MKKHFFHLYDNNTNMPENNIFNLYKEYLETERKGEISESTVDTYHISAINHVEKVWKELYKKEFTQFKFNYKYLMMLKNTAYEGGFSGQMSFIPFLKNLINENRPPLNKILFGPPGTGKTYITKKLAVETIDGEASENREEVSDRYLELIEKKQIQFLTFHQSFSYEDFVEGIKPSLNDEDQVIYEVQDGVFKQICELASSNKESNFEKSYSKLIKLITEGKDDYLILKTPTDKTFRINVNSKGNLSLFTSEEIKKQGVLSKKKLLKHFNGDVVFSGWEGYASGVISYMEEEFKLKNKSNLSNIFVLIIDEINRGNVSSIFGELITLIEEDKRKGSQEFISALLPYSKEKFSVPNNLHIIGTMNTADRSVEALDTALRRRFSFEEIAPNSELIKTVGKLKEDNGIIKSSEIDIAEILDTVNRRIEKLIDKDHKIGHSYFLNVSNIQDLKDVFQKNIIPLLQEYFFGDFGKIGLVIGSDFYTTKENEINEDIFFAEVEDYDFGGLHEKKTYDFINVSEMENDKFKIAIGKLLRN